MQSAAKTPDFKAQSAAQKPIVWKVAASEFKICSDLSCVIVLQSKNNVNILLK